MLMTSKWYKDNEVNKPGLIQRMDTLGFAIFIVSAVGIWIVHTGFQEYKDGVRVHTELHEEVSKLKARVRILEVK